MAKAHIPQTADELTAAWFTEMLGVGHGASVVAVATEPVGDGIGFIGDLHRCHLTWAEGRHDLPSSVIVKVPAALDVNRSVGEALQAYEREIVAYRDMGAHMGLPMPDFHLAQLDPHPAPWIERPLIFLLEKLPLKAVDWMVQRFVGLSGKSTRRYLLVMEDIDDARPPSQVAGGSIDDAMAALSVLARFHAHHWMSDAADDWSPLIWPMERTPKVFQAGYRRNRAEFAERFEHVIGSDKMAVLDDAQDKIPELVGQLGARPWTLLHGDYRLDNLLFRPDDSLVVLDYQLLLRGRPGWDVAYFITTALDAEHKGDEERMLRHYHSALAEARVDEPFDDLVADVDAAKVVFAHRMVSTGDMIDTSMEGSDDSFLELIVQRSIAWIG